MTGRPPRPSYADRERAADRLREACADDRLSLDTFAERLDVAYAARTEAELARLFADLPEPSWLSRLAFTAVNAASRWTYKLGEAWREPRARRLSRAYPLAGTGAAVRVLPDHQPTLVADARGLGRLHGRERDSEARVDAGALPRSARPTPT